MKLYLVVYGAGLTYSVHGAFLDAVDANTKCTKEARNHYDPDNWRVLEEELVTETPGAQPAPSAPTIEAELLRQNILELVNQYGDERAIESYHGDLHCRKAPKDLFAEIERAPEKLSAPKPEGK